MRTAVKDLPPFAGHAPDQGRPLGSDALQSAYAKAETLLES